MWQICWWVLSAICLVYITSGNVLWGEWCLMDHKQMHKTEKKWCLEVQEFMGLQHRFKLMFIPSIGSNCGISPTELLQWLHPASARLSVHNPRPSIMPICSISSQTIHCSAIWVSFRHTREWVSGTPESDFNHADGFLETTDIVSMYCPNWYWLNIQFWRYEHSPALCC